MSYKDYGLQLIDPWRIEIDPPLEPGWTENKTTPRDDYDRCLDNIDGVRARIDQGAALDDLAALGRSEDPKDKAIGESYEMFWGGDPVKVTRVGDHFVTDNGRHRAQAAQEKGLDLIPARVEAPEGDPEFANKPYDAARQPSRKENEMNPERYNPIEMPEAKPEQEQDPSRRHDPFFTGNWGDATQSGSDPMAASDDRQQAESAGDQMDGAEAAPGETTDGSRDQSESDSLGG